MSSSPPTPVPLPHTFRICVTGAAGSIGYLLLSELPVLQLSRTVELYLLDVPPAMETLRGVVMELEDSAQPQLRAIVATDIPRLAFQQADLVILLGSSPWRPGQEIPDLLENNISLFKDQAKLINEVASKEVKVLVVGNPCNTNAWVCKQHAPAVPSTAFTAVSRLDHNRACSFVRIR